MAGEITPIPIGSPTFIDAPRINDLDDLDADIAVIGVPYGVPYGVEGAKQRSASSTETVRAQSMRFSRYLTHYDVDFEGEIFAGRDVRVVDCGDVTMEPGAYEANFQATTAVMEKILASGAVPIVLGGDHAIPIPVMRAYENHGPIFVVQLDEHFDWREEVGGVTQGLSSPMRRASEMDWVSGMAQIGLRAVGSARQGEVDDANAYGSILVNARELHRDGVEPSWIRSPMERGTTSLSTRMRSTPQLRRASAHPGLAVLPIMRRPTCCGASLRRDRWLATISSRLSRHST